MKHLIYILPLTVLIHSCSPKDAKSDIERINCLDTLSVWENEADSVYIEQVDSTLYFKNYRLNKETIAYASYRNENLKAIGKKVNNVIVQLNEVYPNGQAVGNVGFNKTGKVDGVAKYYFEDGRIRSTGNWINGKQSGEWREYDNQGNLIEIRKFDNKGNLLEKELIR